MATPAASPIATPVRKRPTSSAGRSFHAASNPEATIIVATPASIAHRRPMRGDEALPQQRDYRPSREDRKTMVITKAER